MLKKKTAINIDSNMFVAVFVLFKIKYAIGN